MNATIKKIKILNIDINFPKELDHVVDIEVKCEAKILKPRDKEDKHALLQTKISMKANNVEDFSINLLAQVLFEFDKIPENYDSMAEEKCIPLAIKEILTKVDSILENMGCARMKLAEQLV